MDVDNIKGFVFMSKYAGMREDLVQAGGGNSAYKIKSDKMLIKASGYQLADVTETDGYAIVNPKVIRDRFMSIPNLDEMTEMESKKVLEDAFIEGRRPSIETFLHSISGRYSLHTHSIVVNVLACRRDGEDILKELFPQALIVPYATPGVQLAKSYFSAYREYKNNNTNEPGIVFLMNHGLLVSADTVEEVVELTEQVTLKIENYLHIDNSSYHNVTDLYKLYSHGIIWKVTDINVINTYENRQKLWKHCFCPDCVVFLGKEMYDVPNDRIDVGHFTNFVERNGYPVVIGYRGNVYIHADSVKKAMEIQSVLSFSAQVMLNNVDCDCNLLTEDEQNFLLDWDAEKYRKSIK